jgi:Zn-dependent alcohol dehydrogenase
VTNARGADNHEAADEVEELVSRTYRLEEINEGFAAMRGGQVARGVIVFS